MSTVGPVSRGAGARLDGSDSTRVPVRWLNRPASRGAEGHSRFIAHQAAAAG